MQKNNMSQSENALKRLRGRGVNLDTLDMTAILAHKDDLISVLTSLTRVCIPNGNWLGVVDRDQSLKLIFSAKNTLDILSVAFYFAAYEFDCIIDLQKKTLIISGNHFFLNSNLDLILPENVVQKFMLSYRGCLRLLNLFVVPFVEIESAVGIGGTLRIIPRDNKPIDLMQKCVTQISAIIDIDDAQINNIMALRCDSLMNTKLWKYLANDMAQSRLAVYVNLFKAAEGLKEINALKAEINQRILLQLQQCITCNSFLQFCYYVDHCASVHDIPLVDAIANIEIYSYLREKGAKFSLDLILNSFIDLLLKFEVVPIWQRKLHFQHLMEDFISQVQDNDPNLMCAALQGNIAVLTELCAAKPGLMLQADDQKVIYAFYLLLGEVLGRTEEQSQLTQCVSFLSEQQFKFSQYDFSNDMFVVMILRYAVERDRVDVIRFCLDESLIKIDTPISLNENKAPSTLIQLAVAWGTERVISLLIDNYQMDPAAIVHNADVNDIVPLLYVAASSGNIPSVQTLIRYIQAKNGDIFARPTVGNYCGISLPYLIALGGDVAMLRELHRQGFNIDQQSDKDKTPIQAAIAKDDAKIVALLVEECGIKLPTECYFGENMMEYLSVYTASTFKKLVGFCSFFNVVATLEPIPNTIFQKVTLTGEASLQMLGFYLSLDCKVNDLVVNNVTRRYHFPLDAKNLQVLNQPIVLSRERVRKLLGMLLAKDELTIAFGSLNIDGVNASFAMTPLQMVYRFENVSNEAAGKLQCFIAFLSWRFPEFELHSRSSDLHGAYDWCFGPRDPNLRFYDIPEFININKQHRAGTISAAVKLINGMKLTAQSIDWQKAYELIRQTFAANMLKYVKEGNIDAIRDMLLCGDWKINFPITKGRRLIHYANQTGNVDLLRLAMEFGAEPITKGGAGKLTNSQEAFALLIQFTKNTAMQLEWKKIDNAGAPVFCAKSACAITISLFRDYFRAHGLVCVVVDGNLNIDEKLLCEFITNNRVVFSQERIARLINPFSLLQVLLKLASPLIRYLPWAVAEDHYESAVGLCADELSVRLVNLNFFLQYVWQQCGLPVDADLVQVAPFVENAATSGHLTIRYEALLRKEIQQLSWRESVETQLLIKRLILVAQDLSKHGSALVSFEEMLQVLKAAEKDRELKKPKKLSDDNPVARVAPAKSVKETKKKRPSAKARKQSNKQPAAVAKPKPKPQQRKIQPQPPERFFDPCKLPVAVSAKASPAVEHDFSRNNNNVSAVPTENPQQYLPEDKRHQELETLQQLESLFVKMQKLIEAYHKFSPAKLLDPADALAAWHFLHGQICNLLRSLDARHYAKRLVFTHFAYDENRQYNRQKHSYTPPVTLMADPAVLSTCFQDIASFRAVLTYMIDAGCYPDEASSQLTTAVTDAWGQYIENEYTRPDRDLLCIIKTMAIPAAFCDWLGVQIKAYTQHVTALTRTVELCQDSEIAQVLNWTLSFYVSRIGEFAGHIAFADRSKFLNFCRDFRNPVSHTFEGKAEAQITEPVLDMQTWKLHLSSQDNNRFFAMPVVLNIGQLFVNSRYQYQAHKQSSHDVTCLTKLRIANLAVEVSELLTVSANTNLYSCLSPQLELLRAKLTDKTERCILLVPMTINHPVAVALLFKRNEDNVLVLSELSYACVTTHHQIKDVLESLQAGWLEQSKQIIKPTKIKNIAMKELAPDEEIHHGVLQVELLTRLAERHLTPDAKTTPFPKVNMLNKFRFEHIGLWWSAGMQQRYLEQRFKSKPQLQSSTVEDVTPSVTRESKV